ncbi:MAG TPA: hypothetical protein VNA68_00045 [Candidatus Dormibacteraeota bacterium]|nr:hypothetical protein [Candidatus Dormibacteraeota bacterium]
MRQSTVTVLALFFALSATSAFGQANTTVQPSAEAPVVEDRVRQDRAASKINGRPKKRRKHPWKVRAKRFYRLRSTAYALTTQMANQRYPRDGVVAVVRWWPLGRWYQIRSGPLKGKIVKGEDHIGAHSQFDIWMRTDELAFAYGRHRILVAEIPQWAAHQALVRQRRKH